MGDPEGWPQPSGLVVPEGSSPGFSFSSLDDERWVQAEKRTLELINRIQPTNSSELRRRAVTEHVQRLIRKCFDCQVFTFGSVPLKTYLPDGDIDLTAFSRLPHLKDSWANDVRTVLEAEERRKDAEFRVKEVQYIQAEVKIIKCLVENIVVDISFNQLGGLCTLCFLEEVDRLIGRDHLFKRSIILVKAWCYYESRILGAHHGLISTYALETLVLYIFHVFHASLHGPLGVLFRFLEFFSNFDWEKYCISLSGPIPLAALPEMHAEPPRKDGGPLLLTKAFLDGCAGAYANGSTLSARGFGSKYFNVVDPLKTSNNLGRSVSKGNFFRIRSAFSFGAKKLARILECPIQNVIEELDKFFLNTWDRHGSGKRPDAPEQIERFPGAEPDDEERLAAGEGKKGSTALAGELSHELSGITLRAEQKTEDQTSEAAESKAPGIIRAPRAEDFILDSSAKGTQPPTWGSVDIQPFYPRSAPPHPDHDDVSSWDGSNRGFSPSGIPPLQHLPGPPPPPLSLHPGSDGRIPSFGVQFPVLRGPVPPPLPPYGRSGVQRMMESDIEESQRGKESEDLPVANSRNGKKELSPEAAIFYEQNGQDEEIRFGSHANGRKDTGATERKATEDGDGTEAWPVLDAQQVYQYSQMGPVMYPGQPSPDGSTAPSSEGSSPVPYPHKLAASTQVHTIGIPVSPGFLRPSSSETTLTSAGRKQHQRPVDNQPLYYAPFPYMPLYNSFPVYVLPSEEGESRDEDGRPYGVGEKLVAAGVAVSSAAQTSGENHQSSSEKSERDLLSSDFVHHLRNLDYGRACQASPGPFFVQPAFPPFAKELQGHYTWEGPGRPVQGGLNSFKHGSSRYPRNFRSFGPPGFSGDDASNSKSRSGTGTYLPGPRQAYRERQFKAQHEGYQEREESPRYQRGVGRGQKGGKTGDKGWSDSSSTSSNSNNNNFHRNSGLQPPVLNLEPYSHALVNGNGVSPTGPPFVFVYPSDPLAQQQQQQQVLEFGSVGSSSEQVAAAPAPAAAGAGRGRGSGTNQQQVSPPKNQQRASQRSYEMKEEDFPPLSFRGGSSSSSSSTSTGNRSYQSYVASHS